jgi:hypothetical protein
MIRVLLLALVLILPGLAGCARDVPAPTLNDVAFEAALRDSAGQSAANAFDALFAISDDNGALIWRDAARRDVLMVSLMSQSAYDRYWKGKDKGRTFAGRPVSWVTAAPQVQAFCRSTGLSGDALKLRLKQLLGLHPDRDYAVFVEIWVDRGDLFRPCPDPEVDDRNCNVSFQVRNGLPVAPKVKGVPDFIAWYNETYQGSYVPSGAPWTRLGYTYDWHPNTPKFGASEYLITTDAPYEIERAQTIDDYCKP